MTPRQDAPRRPKSRPLPGRAGNGTAWDPDAAWVAAARAGYRSIVSIARALTKAGRPTPRSTAHDWFSGRSTPCLDDVRALARLFGCSQRALAHSE
jgi:hypothetical protein